MDDPDAEAREEDDVGTTEESIHGKPNCVQGALLLHNNHLTVDFCGLWWSSIQLRLLSHVKCLGKHLTRPSTPKPGFFP